MEKEYIHKELSGKIINAAMYVLNELRRRGHVVEQQRHFPVLFRDIEVGTLIPDMIVDGLIIVDPKVVTAFNENHLAQMTGYLAITQLDLALLINFKFAKINVKRVIRSSSANSA